MYLPPYFAEARPAELHRIIREHPLGMLVTHTVAGLDASHLPFVLDPDRGPCGTLLAHIARANELATEVADGAPVLVVFRGAAAASSCRSRCCSASMTPSMSRPSRFWLSLRLPMRLVSSTSSPITPRSICSM